MPYTPANVMDYRITAATQRHFWPNPWSDLTSLQLELICMKAEGKIDERLLAQGMQEARDAFKKKEKVRMR